MTWRECAEKLLMQETFMDGLELSVITGQYVGHSIPPIIKVSQLMLEHMNAGGSTMNAFVFPERSQAAFLFALVKVIHDIDAGRIQGEYDPYRFVAKEHLKYDGCVVRYDTTDNERIWVCTSRGDRFGLPLEAAPFFQRVTTKSLASADRFSKVVNAAILNRRQGGIDTLLERIRKYQTHLTDTVYFVTRINAAKEMFQQYRLDGRTIPDLLLLGQANEEGKITNFTSGQLVGMPALTITTSVYSVLEAAKRKPGSAVVIDVSSPAMIEQQLDAIEQVRARGMQLLFIADQATDTGLSLLESRGGNVWRWDRHYLLPELAGEPSLNINKRVRNCLNQQIEAICLQDQYLSEAVTLLFRHKAAIEDASAAILDIYYGLLTQCFSFLRRVIALSATERGKARAGLELLQRRLEPEKPYHNAQLYKDFRQIIERLLAVVAAPVALAKPGAFERVFEDALKAEKICVLLHDNDKVYDRAIRDYFMGYVQADFLSTSEFLSRNSHPWNTLILCGWYGAATMSRIIHSNAAANLILLLYPCEKSWYDGLIKKTDIRQRTSPNHALATKLFGIDLPRTEITTVTAEPGTTDEPDEVELTLRSNRYRRYHVASSGSEAVEAIPVSYIGDRISFFRSGHKVITVTDIITRGSDEIRKKLPKDLAIGDFVVLRESKRDLIRELADRILEKSGMADARKDASHWKEALKVECSFIGFDAMCAALKSVGCARSEATIRNWLDDDERILPQDRSDLRAIAEATQDGILYDTIDKVQEAGENIQRAHIRAGRILSQRFCSVLPGALAALGEIDVFDLWEPLPLDIDEAGRVQVLKVIDIGQPAMVDATYLDRLITTWEG